MASEKESRKEKSLMKNEGREIKEVSGERKTPSHLLLKNTEEGKTESGKARIKDPSNKGEEDGRE